LESLDHRENAPEPEHPRRRISLLGATGRLGGVLVHALAQRQAAALDRFAIMAISADRNVDSLVTAAELLRPTLAVTADETAFRHLRDRLRPTGVTPGSGAAALKAAALLPSDDLITTLPGSAALDGLAACCTAGRRLYLADANAWAMGGDVLRQPNAELAGTVQALHPIITPMAVACQLLQWPNATLVLHESICTLDSAALFYAIVAVTGQPAETLKTAAWPEPIVARLCSPDHGMADIRAWTHEELATWLFDGVSVPALVRPTPSFPWTVVQSAEAEFLRTLLDSPSSSGINRRHASRVAVLAGLDMIRAIAPELAGPARLALVRSLAKRSDSIPMSFTLTGVVMHDFEARAAAHELLRRLT
jgi:1-deoxy-D-xylulose 5-phosphate reductoisomerase